MTTYKINSDIESYIKKLDALSDVYLNKLSDGDILNGDLMYKDVNHYSVPIGTGTLCYGVDSSGKLGYVQDSGFKSWAWTDPVASLEEKVAALQKQVDELRKEPDVRKKPSLFRRFWNKIKRRTSKEAIPIDPMSFDGHFHVGKQVTSTLQLNTNAVPSNK
jgi:hypothetical protein